MSATPATYAPQTQWTGPQTRWERIFLFLVGSLASTVMLKLGPIQYLEILYLIQIAIIAGMAVKASGRVAVFRPLFRIGACYGCFIFLAVALAVASLRYDFYLPDDLEFVKRPVIITISRAIELFGNVFVMLYLANQFRRFPGKLRFTLRVYFWTGIASGIYALLSYPLDVAGIVSLGSYLDTHRLRGFYNEGGPWGLYVLSVALVGFALYRLQWESRKRIWLGWAVLAIVLPMSASKAAAVALPLFFLLTGLLARRFITRLTLISGLAVALIAISQVIDIGSLYGAYLKASDTYERASLIHHNDFNFVYGRVAGLFIVPRMVAAHPLTGIGWGNYGLVRNSPEYRGASDWAEFYDDPGLGVAGLTADLGLPLFGFLLVCIALPVFIVRRLRVPAYAASLTLAQPVAHLCGAQLNLTYPWIMTALGLGLAFWMANQTRATPPPAALPVSSS